MPKRSNQIQKLIKYISEQLAPEGAKVEESVLLEEKGVKNPSEREIDILLEYNIGISTIRIAIECRDRERTDNITWIDSLIGQYANLPVDKVIAISRSGFSSNAIEKAELNNIITMTLDKASEVNWNKQFLKIGIGQVDLVIKFEAISFTTKPPLETKLSSDDKLILESDKGTVNDFVNKVTPILLRQIKKYLDDNLLSVYKKLSDLDKDGVVEQKLPTEDLILMKNGKRYDVIDIKVNFRIKTNYTTQKVKRHLLDEKAMITSTIIPKDENIDFSFSAVQIKDKPKGRLFVEEIKSK